MAIPPPTVSAAPNPLTCEGYPEPRVFLESQAWWNKAGIQIPQAVGHHIHLGMCTPVDGQIIDGTLHFDVRIILHDQVGTVTSVRYSDWTTDLVTKSVNFPGAHDATYWTSFDINFSNWTTGRHEIHWRANVPDEQPDGLPGSDSGDQRMFQSTGWQYCVRSCTPNAGGNDRAFPWTEARGWYQGHEYQNARFRSLIPTSPLSGNWTFSAEFKRGSGGLPSKEWGIFVDPDFHNGNAGKTIVRGLGEVTSPRNFTIDTRTLTNGKHKLVLVTSDGNDAGVLVIPFEVNNGGTPTPTPTPTATSTATPTATPTPVPTNTPTPTATPTPRPTITPTPTTTVTPTPTASPTPSPTPAPTCFPPRAKRCR